MCEKCRKAKYLTAMGPADACGHTAPRLGMKFCPKCAKAKKVCEACGEPLTGLKKFT